MKLSIIMPVFNEKETIRQILAQVRAVNLVNEIIVMETGYKVLCADIAKGLKTKSDRWGIDPEITAKVLKRGNRIFEVPISYYGREFHEGKKISWHDGFAVMWTLLKYRFVD